MKKIGVRFFGSLLLLLGLMGCNGALLDYLSTPVYTLTYSKGDATAGTVPLSSRKYREGAQVQVSANTGNLQKTGFVFVGWTVDPSGEGTALNPGDDLLISGDLLLYPVWSLTAHTVTFDSRGGSEVAPQTISAGGLLEQPAAPVKAGVSFGGWYRQVEMTTPWNFATDTVSEDLTLYANWLTSGWTVTFDSQGGSSVSSLLVAAGSLVSQPASPSRTGYTFQGWYRDSAGTSAWNFASDTVTGTLTLYALWEINHYTVTYDSLGGSAVTAVVADHGDTLTAPAAPTRSGYGFEGWYKEASGTTAWNFASDTVTGTLTLYAKWSAVTVTFTEAAPSGDFTLKNSTIAVSGSDVSHSYYFAGPAAYNADKTVSYPLVIWLHAWGSTYGNPSTTFPAETNTRTRLTELLASGATYPAFVYVPLIPAPYNAGDTPIAPLGGEWNSTEARGAVLATIADLQTRFNINPKRIYIMGFSMGGAGSWYIGSDYHQKTGSRFAAVVRGAGGYLSSSQYQADTLENLTRIHADLSLSPTWLNVGGAEGLGYDISLDNYHYFQDHWALGSETVVNKTVSANDVEFHTQPLTTTGGEMRFSNYVGKGHVEGLMFLDPDLFPWMFSKSLP